MIFHPKKTFGPEGWLLLLLCFCMACQPSSSEKPTEVKPEKVETPDELAKPLSFLPQIYTRQSSTCDQEGKPCLKIDLKYLVAENGPAPVRDSINRFIMTQVIGSIGYDAETQATTLKAASDSLFLSYKEEQAALPDLIAPWQVEDEVKSAFHKGFAVIEVSSYTYFGAAHPNQYVSIANFNLRTGQQWRYEEFVTDTTAFQAIVKNRFMEKRQEMEGSFDWNNYFWGGPFALPVNFGLKEEGIHFYYNQYEAAVYAAGVTEFTIPYEKFAGMIKL